MTIDINNESYCRFCEKVEETPLHHLLVTLVRHLPIASFALTDSDTYQVEDAELRKPDPIEDPQLHNGLVEKHNSSTLYKCMHDSGT